MKNDQYLRSLHRRGVLQEIRKMLQDKYIVTDGTPKHQIIVEDAPFVDRVASQDSLIDVSALLSLLEEQETKYLNGFELRPREVSLPPDLKDRFNEPAQAPRRRKRRGQQPPPSSST